MEPLLMKQVDLDLVRLALGLSLQRLGVEDVVFTQQEAASLEVTAMAAFQKSPGWTCGLSQCPRFHSPHGGLNLREAVPIW